MALTDVIHWKWPGARCVVRGNPGAESVERWDGPMAQPSAGELAQAVIDYAADPTIPMDAAVKAAMDSERVFSAIVWAVIDTYSAPATVAKYNAARTKIIAAYKTQPWKP